MKKLPEPDDVDFVVGDVPPDPEATAETIRFLAEYKQTPEGRARSEEARRLWAELGIDHRDFDMPDAQALLEHWHRCRAELFNTDNGEHSETNGASMPRPSNTAGPSARSTE